MDGSSPRWRGTHNPAELGLQRTRFIPALAGNTMRNLQHHGGATVHPRAGGEHSQTASCRRQSSGSSPRWRGTPPILQQDGLGRRFIPALAGNTSRHPVPGSRRTVHPRAGGEHLAVDNAVRLATGSSPRWRGTRLTQHTAAPRRRFIPALAGNTSTSVSLLSRLSVHPRAGGEHTKCNLLIRRVNSEQLESTKLLDRKRWGN